MRPRKHPSVDPKRWSSIACLTCALTALIGLLLQLSLPAVHQLHHRWADSAEAAAADHHDACDAHDAHEDAHHEPQSGHDESTCPTCQLFASLRTYAPLTMEISIGASDSVVVRDSAAPRTFVAQTVDLPAAPPRGPPVSC